MIVGGYSPWSSYEIWQSGLFEYCGISQAFPKEDHWGVWKVPCVDRHEDKEPWLKHSITEAEALNIMNVVLPGSPNIQPHGKEGDADKEILERILGKESVKESWAKKAMKDMQAVLDQDKGKEGDEGTEGTKLPGSPNTQPHGKEDDEDTDCDMKQRRGGKWEKLYFDAAGYLSAVGEESDSASGSASSGLRFTPALIYSSSPGFISMPNSKAQSAKCLARMVKKGHLKQK